MSLRSKSARGAARHAFTVPEAAAILGLPQREVSNAIDRELKPLRLAKAEGGSRAVTAKGLVALELLRAFAEQFSPGFRREVVRAALRAPNRPAVSLEKGRIVVNISELRKKVDTGEGRLREAEALVVSSPEILGGEPCVRGTRVPAYLVGALAAKYGVEEAVAAYPSLTREQVDLISLYVAANPRRGRPPQSKLSRPKAPAKRGKARKVRLGSIA
jgi:uncharacterized protein (DUF433 family)